MPRIRWQQAQFADDFACCVAVCRRCGLLGLMLCLLGSFGCQAWIAPGDLWTPQPESVLKPVQPTREAMELNIVHVKVPYGHPEVNEALWNEVDELWLPVETRNKLQARGIRVGIVAGSLPPGLERHLNLQDAQPATEYGTRGQFELKPKVQGKIAQLKKGQLELIAASPVLDELPLLLPSGDTLAGRTLHRAQGVFALKTFPDQEHGQVRLEILPQIHYGEPVPRFNSNPGMLVYTHEKEKEIFSELKFEAQLAPGQFLLMTCIPELQGSLGDHFFGDRTVSPREQKLILIRVSSQLSFQEADNAGTY